MRSKDHHSQSAYGLLCGVYGHLATNEIANEKSTHRQPTRQQEVNHRQPTRQQEVNHHQPTRQQEVNNHQPTR